MGAPVGNKNAAKGKRWAAAIERALERKATGKQRPEDVSDLIKGLDLAAEEFIAKLFDSKDLGYFKELGERMDGKAQSEVSIEHSGAIEHLGLPEVGVRVAELLSGRAEGDSPALLPH